MYSAFTIEKLIMIALQPDHRSRQSETIEKRIFYTGLIYILLQSYHVAVIPNIGSFHICRMIWSELWPGMWGLWQGLFVEHC